MGCGQMTPEENAEALTRFLSSIDQASAIYVENVRAFLAISRSAAEELCEIAHQRGWLTKHLAYLCPNDDRILFEWNDDATLQQWLACEVCEAMERDQFVFESGNCATMVLYRMPGGRH